MSSEKNNRPTLNYRVSIVNDLAPLGPGIKPLSASGGLRFLIPVNM